MIVLFDCIVFYRFIKDLFAKGFEKVMEMNLRIILCHIEENF